MEFRKDINGLRAIAVLAVVLFHFNPELLPGGFAGVDVFFVISGFLMTGIIFRGLESNSFSILRFYLARANRIIPALSALCFFLLIVGWFYITPLDYKDLSQHIASSMSFVSNITYWLESGYFDADSHEKWLLHTWSLSVEWQFYIIYPLVLVVMKKFMSHRTMKFTILIGALIGFIFCMFATFKWPSASFFLLPTRAWEMMMGGVAYLFPVNLNKNNKVKLEAVGFSLILASYIFLSKDDLWPGYLSLLPVLGAFFIIQSQRNDSLLTSNVISQKLGLWSYSIYLWHWPIVVAFNYLLIKNYPLGILLSLFVGYISYRLIENRYKNKLSKINISGVMLSRPFIFVYILSSLGYLSFLNEGFTFRQDNKVTELEKQIVMPKRNNGYCFYSSDMNGFEPDKEIGKNCVLGDKNLEPKTLVFGDSYAGTYDPFWNEIFEENHISFRSVVTNWCFPSLGTSFTGPKTDPAYQQCLLNREYLSNHMGEYDNLIIAGSWGAVYDQGHIDEVVNVIKVAASLDINVIIMSAATRYDTDIKRRFLSSVFNDNFKLEASLIPKNKDKFVLAAHEILEDVSNKFDNVTLIKREHLFNKSDTFEKDGFTIPYSLDGGHISLLGSLESSKFFSKTSMYSHVIETINTQS
ncbi:acyltransferase [Vibrio parahaemolyticus]|nr:acyltransferase [Vibrio parahaemolyticus]HCE2836194.1 acyltransferase [Vibrio parahaemolyticus]